MIYIAYALENPPNPLFQKGRSVFLDAIIPAQWNHINGSQSLASPLKKGVGGIFSVIQKVLP
jgi:hypothetical protein